MDQDKHFMATTAARTAPSSKNFFSLPAELRNIIYAFIAANAPNLILKFDHYLDKELVPKMLLTTHAVAEEYKPIMLATVRLKVDLESYKCTSLDWSCWATLARFVKAMPESEYNALKSNPSGMMIEIPLKLIGTGNHDAFPALQTWLKLRSPGDRFDSITWRYEISHPPVRRCWDESGCVGPISFATQTNHIEYARRGLAKMRSELNEGCLDEADRLQVALSVVYNDVYNEWSYADLLANMNDCAASWHSRRVPWHESSMFGWRRL